MVYSVAGLSLSSPRPISLLQPASEVSFQPQGHVVISMPTDWPRSRASAFGDWQFDADSSGFRIQESDQPLIRYSSDHGLEVAERVFHNRQMLVFLCKRVLPAVSAQFGALILHGTAVVVDGRALVVCAPSGRGKSTLLAALLEAGVDFLTDDVLAVWQGDVVHPGPTFCQLVQEDTPPTQTKQIVHPTRVWRSDARLTDIVSLDDFGPYQLTRVSGSDALLTILNSFYFAAPDDKAFPWSRQARDFFKTSDHHLRSGRAQRDMHRAAELSRQARVWHFSYPRGLDVLHTVVQRFLNNLDRTPDDPSW